MKAKLEEIFGMPVHIRDAMPKGTVVFVDQSMVSAPVKDSEGRLTAIRFELRCKELGRITDIGDGDLKSE